MQDVWQESNGANPNYPAITPLRVYSVFLETIEQKLIRTETQRHVEEMIHPNIKT